MCDHTWGSVSGIVYFPPGCLCSSSISIWLEETNHTATWYFFGVEHLVTPSAVFLQNTAHVAHLLRYNSGLATNYHSTTSSQRHHRVIITYIFLVFDTRLGFCVGLSALHLGMLRYFQVISSDCPMISQSCYLLSPIVINQTQYQPSSCQHIQLISLPQHGYFD